MTGSDIAVLLGFLAASIALAGFAGIVTSGTVLPAVSEVHVVPSHGRDGRRRREPRCDATLQ